MIRQLLSRLCRLSFFLVLTGLVTLPPARAASSIEFKGAFSGSPLISSKAKNKIEVDINGDTVQGLAVVTIKMPAGEYCNQGGTRIKFDKEVEAKASVAFAGKMGPGGVAKCKPDEKFLVLFKVSTKAVDGGEQHFFRVNPILEVQRKGAEIKGALTFQWPTCNGGLWRLKSTEELGVPIHAPDHHEAYESFKHRITNGMMGLSVKFKSDKVHAPKIYGKSHQTIFSWKPAPPKEGRKGEKFIMSGRLVTKGGELEKPGHPKTSAALAFWKCKGQAHYPEGNLPKLDLTVPHSSGSNARELEKELRFPFYEKDCGGEPELFVRMYSCLRRIGLKYKYAWEKAVMTGEQVRLPFGMPSEGRTGISVCPRVGPGESERLTAAVFAHPDFPARITVNLTGDNRAFYSLPPGAKGMLSFNGVDWDKKLETWTHTARNVHGPTQERIYYSYKGDPVQPLSTPLTEEVLVEIKDASGEVIEAHKVKILVGIGLDLAQVKMFQGLPLSAGKGYVVHALKALVKSRHQPSLDLGWFEKECNRCRGPEGSPEDGRMPGGMKVDFRGIWLNQEGRAGPRNEIDIFSGGTVIETVKSSGHHFLSPLTYTDKKGKHRRRYIGAIFAQGTTDGQSHTIYPAVKQNKKGHYVIMVRARPRLKGKLIRLPESNLEGTYFFIATLEQPETMYQSIACALQPTTVSQVVILETLKLIPAYGSKIGWGLNLTEALCKLSHQQYQEGFLGLLSEGVEDAVESVVFEVLTPAALKKKYPNLKDADLKQVVEHITTAYKIAKSKYKIIEKSGKLNKQ